MMSAITPDKIEAEAVPGDGAVGNPATVPAGRRPLPAAGRTQRAEGGGYDMSVGGRPRAG